MYAAHLLRIANGIADRNRSDGLLRPVRTSRYSQFCSDPRNQFSRTLAESFIVYDPEPLGPYPRLKLFGFLLQVVDLVANRLYRVRFACPGLCVLNPISFGDGSSDIATRLQQRLRQKRRITSQANYQHLGDCSRDCIGEHVEVVVLRDHRFVVKLGQRRKETRGLAGFPIRYQRSEAGAVRSYPSVPYVVGFAGSVHSAGFAVVVLKISFGGTSDSEQSTIQFRYRDRCPWKQCRHILHVGNVEMPTQHLENQGRTASGRSTDEDYRTSRRRCRGFNQPLFPARQDEVERNAQHSQSGGRERKKRCSIARGYHPASESERVAYVSRNVLVEF